MTSTLPAAAPRIADHPIDEIHLARWSPRAFDSTEISEAELFSLFEAARWAPSAFNVQPWRFVYAMRDTPEWEGLFSALTPMNQGWVQHASVLIYALADTLVTPPGQTELVDSATASFDTGAAWAAFALQATTLGLHAHAMAGFDRARAAEVLGNSDRFRIEAAIALGRIGDPASLPEPLRAREFPSARRPLSETVFIGSLPQD